MTGTPYFTVSEASGAILSTGTASPASMIPLQARPGVLVFEGIANPDTQWWNGSELEERTPLPEPNKTTIQASGTDAVEFLGLPPNTKVSIRGPATRIEAEVLDGALAFDADYPGTYTITLTCEPRYLRKEVTIVAT